MRVPTFLIAVAASLVLSACGSGGGQSLIPAKPLVQTNSVAPLVQASSVAPLVQASSAAPLVVPLHTKRHTQHAHPAQTATPAPAVCISSKAHLLCF